MAFYQNEVRLLGYIGTVQAPAEGSPLKFSLATTRTWKDQNQDLQESTDWHTVAVWQPPQQLLAKIATGARAIVEGRLSSQSFEVAGEKRKTVEVVAPARRVEILNPPKPRTEAPPAAQGG